MSNDMGMTPGYNAPSSSMGIGDLMRRQGAMQAITAPPMASNQMGMPPQQLYQTPNQMMGIVSLLGNLFGSNFGQPPVRHMAIGEVHTPEFVMADNDMGMSNFRDQPKATPPAAPVSPPTRVTDMFGSSQGLGGFAQPQMGFGGKGGIKGGGMYGRPSYGMQARYSSPFGNFF
jgi:hypothetical protein